MDQDTKIPQKIEKADFIPTQNSCGFMMSKLNEIQTMAVEHAIKNDGAFVDIGCAYGIAALEGMYQQNLGPNHLLHWRQMSV